MSLFIAYPLSKNSAADSMLQAPEWVRPGCARTIMDASDGAVERKWQVNCRSYGADARKFFTKPLPIAENGSSSSSSGTCRAIHATKVLLFGPGKAL